MTTRPLIVILFSGLAPLLAAPIAPTPANPPPRGIVCPKTTAAPVLDGKLDDAAWTAAPWSDDFADIEGLDKPKPRYRTRMKVTWDDAALYIAAELDEPHVWATIDKHDAVIFNDPDFEVFLDPDGDGHQYAELELNALNTTWDLLLPKPYKDGGKAINAWEITGLKTAVGIRGTLNDPRDKDQGWCVEIAWPWAGLAEMTDVPTPPKVGDRWRANFSRVEWDITTDGRQTTKVPGKPEHNWIWSPQGVIDMHRPERWGNILFLAAGATAADYQPDPAQPMRAELAQLYYAQRAYHDNHQRYARSVAELDLRLKRGTMSMTPTAGGYEATIVAADGVWGVTNDARFWRR